MPILILFFLALVMLSGITTIPLSLPLLVILSVFFRKSWVFFVAFGLGLLLDLFWLRSLGQTALMLVLFVLFINLYERKFETQTLTFVFSASFLGSLIYLQVFGYQQILLQSLVNSLLTLLLFKLLIKKQKILPN